MSRRNRNKSQRPAAAPVTAPPPPVAPPAAMPPSPPHPSCRGGEDWQAFSRLHRDCIAKYRPADETERYIVGEIAACQWRTLRNSEMETAIYNREHRIRTRDAGFGFVLDCRDLDVAVDVHEALRDHKTVAALRRETMRCHRAIALLERRLKELQKTWPQVAPPPEPAQAAAAVVEPEHSQTTPPPASQPAAPFVDVDRTAPINNDRLFRVLFGPKEAGFSSRPLDRAA